MQAPAEAAFPDMPEAALRAVKADYIMRSSGIAELLTQLLTEPINGKPVADAPEIATRMDLEEPFALTCPECGGAVHEVPGTGILTYRCHTGHRFGADELLVYQTSDVERAIMVAIRVLRERTALCRRMIEEATAAGRTYGVATGGASRVRQTTICGCCSISCTCSRLARAAAGSRHQPRKPS